MDSLNTKIEIEIPKDIRILLVEKSRRCGMDESSYATRVIIDYLRLLNESRRSPVQRSENPQ
jgi:hypothetical protein